MPSSGSKQDGLDPVDGKPTETGSGSAPEGVKPAESVKPSDGKQGDGTAGISDGGGLGEAPRLPDPEPLGVPGGHSDLTPEQIDSLPIVNDGSHMNPDNTLTPDTWYRTGEHGYLYHTDANGYIDRFIAEELLLKTHDGRLPHDPNTPGKLPGDHAGHLAADQYGGSPKLDNLVSQFSKLNLSKFRRIELQWLKALNREPTPGQVSVDMKIETDPATGRPTKFIVEWFIDGEFFDQVLTQ